ncbi:protein C2-DOMAIN ABA-RELATED 7-like [Arachis stenosperma]|uniref:protein C2-DOMAIN ABA-RELATED 7-like n=1 Tax=Arachis stenosperma TaxID=217475 RepID=UPI0025ABBEAE|nr:protein C2-DOMAIN ABA-RELATED 7-like [Arachis stenosperma]
METILGFIKLRINRGINLAKRDAYSSDPYVVVKMGEQKLKTAFIRKNINPVWNEELTLYVKDVATPIYLQVFDKDTFTKDDEMGDAVIDLRPYIECHLIGMESMPDGCVVKRIQPNRTNCLAEESTCFWRNGSIVQRMMLRLKNVECGEIECEIEWRDIPGCNGLAELTKS